MGHDSSGAGMRMFLFPSKVEQTWKQHPLRSQILTNTTLNLHITALLFQNVDKKTYFAGTEIVIEQRTVLYSLLAGPLGFFHNWQFNFQLRHFPWWRT
jgi:hypothetical protein